MKIAHWKIHGTLHHSSAWAVYPNSLVGKFRIWSALGVSNIAISCNCSWPRFGCQTLILSQLMCMYIYTIYTIICICNIYIYICTYTKSCHAKFGGSLRHENQRFSKLCPVLRWCPVKTTQRGLCGSIAPTLPRGLKNAAVTIGCWGFIRWLGNVRKTQSAGGRCDGNQHPVIQTIIMCGLYVMQNGPYIMWNISPYMYRMDHILWIYKPKP